MTTLFFDLLALVLSLAQAPAPALPDDSRPIFIVLDLAKFITAVGAASLTAGGIAAGLGKMFFAYMRDKDRRHDELQKKTMEEQSKMAQAILNLTSAIKDSEKSRDDVIRKESEEWRQANQTMVTNLIQMHEKTILATISVDVSVKKVAENVERQDITIERLTQTMGQVVPLVASVQKLSSTVTALVKAVRGKGMDAEEP